MKFFLKNYGTQIFFLLSFILFFSLLKIFSSQKLTTVNFKASKIILFTLLPGENIVFNLSNFSNKEIKLLKENILSKLSKQHNFKSSFNFNYDGDKDIFIFKTTSLENNNTNSKKKILKIIINEIVNFQNNKINNILFSIKNSLKNKNYEINNNIKQKKIIYDTETILAIEKIINLKFSLEQIKFYIKYFFNFNVSDTLNNDKSLNAIISTTKDTFIAKAIITYEKYFKKNNYDLLELSIARNNLRKEYLQTILYTLNQLASPVKIIKTNIEDYILLLEWKNYLDFIEMEIKTAYKSIKNNNKYNINKINKDIDYEFFQRYQKLLETTIYELQTKKMNKDHLTYFQYEYYTNVFNKNILFIISLYLFFILIVLVIKFNFIKLISVLYPSSEILNIEKDIFFLNNEFENARYDYHSILLKNVITSKNIKRCIIALEENNYKEFTFFYELIKKLSKDEFKISIIDLDLKENTLDWLIATSGNLNLKELNNENLNTELKIKSIIENKKNYNLQDYFKEKISLKDNKTLIITSGKKNDSYILSFLQDSNFNILIKDLNEKSDFIFFTTSNLTLLSSKILKQRLSPNAVILIITKKINLIKFIKLYYLMKKINLNSYYSLICNIK